MTTQREYMLQEAQALLDELSPDIDDNGNPDRDMKIATVLDYFIRECSK